MGSAATRMKKRGGSGLVVFGRRAVLEALAEPGSRWSSPPPRGMDPPAFRKELAAACRARGLQLELLPESEIHALTGEPRHDQGVALRLRLTRVVDVEVFVASRKGRAARSPVRVLALDGVTNPQNVGMIVRSVVAAGLDGLLWPRIGSPWVSGLVIKASASALYRCPIVRCDSLAEGLSGAEARRLPIAGLARRRRGRASSTSRLPIAPSSSWEARRAGSRPRPRRSWTRAWRFPWRADSSPSTWPSRPPWSAIGRAGTDPRGASPPSG